MAILWIPDSLIPDSNLKRDFGFLGPNCRIPYSTSKNLPDSGMRINLFGARNFFFSKLMKLVACISEKGNEILV